MRSRLELLELREIRTGPNGTETRRTVMHTVDLPALVRDGCMQSPRVGHSFEGVFSAVCKPQT
jgi:hypothetical protein